MAFASVRPRSVLVLVLAFLATVAPATTAESATERLIVVDADHEAASDGNDGAEGAPVATIGRALELARAANADARPVRVHVRPGVYREELRLPDAHGRTDAALTIEGAGAEHVVVDGADVVDDWTPGTASGTYTTAWAHAWGLSPVPSGWGSVLGSRSEVIRRSEAVWVDGEIMRQVLTAGELEPGTFLVDEAAGELTLRPPAGVSPRDADVEVATRRRSLDIDAWKDVTVRGITFRRAATPLQGAGVRFTRTHGLLVEDVRSDSHNWTGLAVQHARDVTIRRTALTDNGVVGLGLYRTENVDVIDVDNSYNNTWRGPWADYYGWESGSKFYQNRGLTFDNWHAVGNEAYGLWLDTDITDVVVRDSFIARNRRRGLFLEAMQGPTSVTNSTICDNLQEGVLDGKADDVTLTGNRIFGNGRSQLVFSGEAGGRSFTTYDTGERLMVRSRNWTLRDNVIEGAQGSRVIGNHLGADDWDVVRSSMTAAGNRYHHRSDARPFTISQAIVDFAGWQAETGADRSSSFSASGAGLTCDAPRPPVPAEPGHVGDTEGRASDGDHPDGGERRILDTRNDQGDIRGAIGAQATASQQVTGVGGVPEDATAVAINVTAINPTSSSYLTISPTGEPRPTAASLNFPAGRDVGNFIIAKVGDDGKVDVYNHRGRVDVTFDVMGYFPADGNYESKSPRRILDTRESVTVGHRDHIDVPVAGGATSVPADAEAVAINLTAVNATRNSFVTAYATGITRPVVSSLNFQAGQTVSNLVVAEVGDDGRATIYNHNGAVDVVLDVVGYFPAGADLQQVEPARLLDTRNTTQGDHATRVGSREVISQKVTGTAGIPDDASAVAINITAADPTRNSYLTFFPTGQDRPNAATVNFPAGLDTNNMVIAEVGEDGSIDIYNHTGQTHVVIDVVGYRPARTD